MPRDTGGTYSLPSGSTATTGQTILASEHNTPLNDIASALTASLPVDGSKGMSGQLKAADGSVSAPSVSFVSETGTGFYKITTNEIGYSIGGTKVLDWTAATFNLPATTTSTSTTTGALTVGGGVGVVENLNVGGDAAVTGNATVGGTLTVTGTASIDGKALAAAAFLSVGAGLASSGGNLGINTNNSFGIGALAILYNGTGSGISDGSTASGTALFPVSWVGSSHTFTVGGSATSGTWRNISGLFLSAQDSGLFIKTA